MKMRRVKTMLVSLMIISTMLTAACSNSTQTSDTGKKPTEKTKITLTFHKDEIGEGSEVETIFKDFLDTHPDVEIEIVPMDSEDSNLLARIASGNAPDIIRLTAPSAIPTFAVRDILLPLDDYIKNSDKIHLDQMYDIVDLFRFDGDKIGKGSIYGLPKDWSIESQMWINEKIFREAGVKIPTIDDPMTFDEYAAAAKKMTKLNPDGSVAVLGGAPFSNISPYLEYMLCQKGKSYWSSDYSSTTALTDPDTKEALKWIFDLQKSGAIRSKLNEIDPYTWFGEGNLAMWTTGYWAVSYLNQSYKGTIKLNPEDIKLVPGPVYNKNKRVSAVTFTTGAGIYKGTKNPKVAFEVFEYLMGGSPTKVRAEKGFGYPINKDMVKYLPQQTDIDKMAYKSFNNEVQYLFNQPRVNPYVGASSFQAAFDKYYIPALYGETTLDSALESIEKDLAHLISEGKELANGK